jgi:hypothetical protein
MENKILHKYSIFEVKLHLAEMEKQYGKEAVEELIGEDRSAEINANSKKKSLCGLNRIGKTFTTMNTAVSGSVGSLRSDMYSASAAPSATFRNTSFKLLLTI